MISKDQFHKQGIAKENEKTPLDILNVNALTTREITVALNKLLPEGSKPLSVDCVRQKLTRLERKGSVLKRKINEITHWLKVVETHN